MVVDSTQTPAYRKTLSAAAASKFHASVRVIETRGGMRQHEGGAVQPVHTSIAELLLVVHSKMSVLSMF